MGFTANGRGAEGSTAVGGSPVSGKDELERGEEILGETEGALVKGKEAEFGMLKGAKWTRSPRTFIVKAKGQSDSML